MIKECVQEINCFLMPSEFTKERYLARGINRPMEYLPGFVPPAEEGTGLERESGDPERPYFIFAGRLEKLKGAQDLITLFAEYRKARLVIAGSGSFERNLRDQARGLPNVSFIGNVHPSDLNSLYRGAVAVLAPSLCYETFGLSAVEAMMCGTPVIARRIGALKEIVEKSEGGYLFDTLEELKDAMEKLRTQPDLRKKLGQNGRNTALRLWSSKIYIKRYLDIVTSLMESKA
jgi:glycosyltransferase involved in cell wall biosynthesis